MHKKRFRIASINLIWIFVYEAYLYFQLLILVLMIWAFTAKDWTSRRPSYRTKPHKKSTKFHNRKILVLELLLNKVNFNFIKTWLQQMFSCKFREIFKTPILKNICQFLLLAVKQSYSDLQTVHSQKSNHFREGDLALLQYPKRRSLW